MMEEDIKLDLNSDAKRYEYEEIAFTERDQIESINMVEEKDKEDKFDNFYVGGKYKTSELVLPEDNTVIKNEQFAEVEAVNFVKVEVKEEFSGNIFTDAEATSVNPIEELLENGKLGGRRGHLKQCPFCEKQFRDSSKLKYHINTHTNERPFICEVCQHSFNHPRHLRRHILLHKEKTLVCHHCPKTFSDQSLLDLHLKGVGQSFQCTLCGNVYARKQFLQAHERREHTGETPYACNYCEEQFNMSYKLKDHINKQHSSVPLPLFVCEFCGKEYKKKSCMLEHANTHSGEPVNKCDICHQSFNTKTAFRHHLNIHEGKFECEECGKCFGSPRNLDIHKKVHSGVKDFQCSVCVKAYSSIRSLQMHLEIKHNVRQEKTTTFRCDKCDKPYTNIKSLERHMKKH